MTDKTTREAIEAEYARRRRSDSDTEEARLRQAVAECPEIGELRQKQLALVHCAVRSVLHEGSAEKTAAEMARTRDRIGTLLEEHGHPRDWLEPVYQCAVCRDTGVTWSLPRVPCACRRQLERQILAESAGLRTAGESFDTYGTEIFPEDRIIPALQLTQRREMELVRDRLAAWSAKAPAEGPRTVLLQGASGLGKTYLLRCIADAFVRRGIPCLLTRAYAIVEAARKRVFADNDELWQTVMETEALLIDDLGSEPVFQNITIEHLYELIESRQLAGRITVISTNLNQEDFRSRYTERIASRVTDRRECLIISLTGEDVRRRK